jgi:hypothetical protein
MAVQKPKPRKTKKKNVNNTQQWNWTTQRTRAAQLLSTGLYTQKEVAEELSLRQETISRWMHHKVFKDMIDELTLKNELTTRAGLLRECLKGLDLKRDHIENDKNTHLHYVQAIADLQGLLKQKVELEGNMNHTGGAVRIYIPDNGRDPKKDEEQEQS